ncbi:transposase [Escherichia coli]|nr:transposase [Salmonella enterica]KUR36661.1 transposase [Escherichia coli]KZO64033.1 transposase [Escherichia coli]KZP46066.1 transposase [Escherichia coli]OJO64004.1 transposase [Escherichia coli]
MDPEHMAESGHRITRPEFPDYRELFRESDIKSAVVDSIGQRNSYVKTWGCGGFLNETNIYSRGKSLCF